MLIAGCAGFLIVIAIVIGAIVVTRDRRALRAPQDDPDEFVVSSKDAGKDA